MISKNDLLEIPIKWPKSYFNYSVSGYDVFYIKEYEERDVYGVSIIISSEPYADFLNRVSTMKNKLESCPKLRNSSGKLKIAEMGRVMHEVIDPKKEITQETLVDVDPTIFELGLPLLHLGFANLYESSFQNFAIELLNSFSRDSSRVQAFLRGGIVYDNLSNFDPFYSFVFVCNDSGKTVNDCYRLLPKAGLVDKYPKNQIFNLDKVTLKDVEILYKVLEQNK